MKDMAAKSEYESGFREAGDGAHGLERVVA